MPEKIETAERALELLERVVAARGHDFIYWAPLVKGDDMLCKYAYDNKPSCGVGVALL